MSEENLHTQKKRGRPRKHLNNNKNIDKNVNMDLSIHRELILHLPITCDNPSDKKMDNPVVIDQTEIDEDSESSKDFLEEIKKRDKKIKELTKELQHYKALASNFNINSKNITCYPADLKLICNKTGISIITDKTEIPCWHCTEKFDTVPCFIPERYDRGIYYVFGCFCSINCSATYNMALGDYRKNDRHSLILEMYSFVIKLQEICFAPQKEVLEKYLGPSGIKISKFRESSLTCNVKFKLLMPPCIPIIPFIEERTMDNKNDKKKKI